MTDHTFKTRAELEAWINLGECIANMRGLPDSKVKEIRDRIRCVTLAHAHLMQETK